MKPLLIVALLSVLGTGCSQFPTRFERIEPDKIRFINYSFLNQAEGAPGDTMRVRAFFAGEKVASVAFSMSYDRVTNQYGDDTVINVRDLATFDVVDRLPDSIDFSFVIPDSTFFKTQAISGQTLDLLRSQLPSSMGAMSQQQYAAFLRDAGNLDMNDPLAFAQFADTWGRAAGITSLDSAGIETLMEITGRLAGFFSIRGELFTTATSENGHSLKIRGDFTIRYNSRFAGTPFAEMAPVNRNPAVRWIGVYKVKNFTGVSFSPEDPAYAGKFTLSYLYNERFPWKTGDSILIERGYSYFLCADSGSVTYSLSTGDSMMVDGQRILVPRDTVFSDSVLDSRIIGFDSEGKPRREYETYFYNWMYQPLSDDVVTLPRDSLFVISGVGEGGGQPPIVRFLPSVDKKMAHARIWVSVYDQLLGELYRPRGFTVRVVDLYFKYAE